MTLQTPLVLSRYYLLSSERELTRIVRLVKKGRLDEKVVIFFRSLDAGGSLFPLELMDLEALEKDGRFSGPYIPRQEILSDGILNITDDSARESGTTSPPAEEPPRGEDDGDT